MREIDITFKMYSTGVKPGDMHYSLCFDGFGFGTLYVNTLVDDFGKVKFENEEKIKEVVSTEAEKMRSFFSQYESDTCFKLIKNCFKKIDTIYKEQWKIGKIEKSETLLEINLTFEVPNFMKDKNIIGELNDFADAMVSVGEKISFDEHSNSFNFRL